MKVLIFSLQVSESGSRGHLHPWLAVVQRLASEGHEVLWCPVPAAMGEEDRATVRFAGARVVDPPPLPEGLIAPVAQLGRWALDPQQIWRAYQSFLVDPVPHQLAGLRALLADLQPDVVAMDCMAYAPALACRIEGRPYLGLCAGLKLLHEGPFEEAYQGHFEPVLEARARLFAEHGQRADFRLFECVSPHDNVVFTAPSFLPGPWSVGPSRSPERRGDEPEFPWERLEEDFFYASFGSVHGKIALPEVVPALVAACDRQLVLSSTHYRDLGPRVLIVDYAPQLELLRRCRVYICHGGANSVCEALTAGVPMLVIPLSSDQPMQARLVEKAGVGLGVWPGGDFAGALRRLAGEPAFRERSASLARDFAALDGAGETVRRMKKLCKSC